MVRKQMILNENSLMMPEPDSISKNEYIALELVRSWALGLPNRSGLFMDTILENYDKALKHLEDKE